MSRTMATARKVIEPMLRPFFASSFRRGLSTESATRPLLVLGLESSADDTCAAVVSSDRKILSNVVIKQHSIHESFGGIHPMHAMKAHQANMPEAISRALSEADLSLADIDAFACTRGPGMPGCLGVCNASAKALAAATGKPWLGVHHMQAHALTPFLTASPNTDSPAPEFPFLTLLLSGGHTLLLLARSITSFSILATTHDESIGASIDKVARALQIPWALGAGSPGAALEKFAFPADTASPATPSSSDLPPDPTLTIPFPREMAFSYAGIRSAVTRILDAEPPTSMSDARRRQVARCYMEDSFEHIGEKVGMAMRKLGKEGQEVKGLVVSGGVASNLVLRQRLRAKLNSLGRPELPLIFPPPAFCTDNAAMIAFVGLLRLQRGLVDPLTMIHEGTWPITECEADFEKKEGAEKSAETP
ncbi:glycoprotease [Rhodotorula toruloides]|uniref:N(6)-L-threonylcarbamoyladenine synthase n=2 Tax=Rhodotorula toruloides TaxID=5286 RepID=A0A2T0A6M2_RHOTO|nr:glycoprotease [Rhodotorula toruloides]